MYFSTTLVWAKVVHHIPEDGVKLEELEDIEEEAGQVAHQEHHHYGHQHQRQVQLCV